MPGLFFLHFKFTVSFLLVLNCLYKMRSSVLHSYRFQICDPYIILLPYHFTFPRRAVYSIIFRIFYCIHSFPNSFKTAEISNNLISLWHFWALLIIVLSTAFQRFQFVGPYNTLPYSFAN